jgi:hypothetical protein
MRDHPPAPPHYGSLPDCFDWSLTTELLEALPRPVPGQARVLGRQMITRAVRMVRVYDPRDVLEAQIVQQIVIVSLRATQVEAEARRQETPEQRIRLDAHGVRVRRSVLELERRLQRHRRALESAGHEPEEPGGYWTYDLDALERHWRDEAPLVEDRVPLWVQAGRQFADELTKEEFEELVFAEQRGEVMPLPPGRPAGEGEPRALMPLVPPGQPARAAA